MRKPFFTAISTFLTLVVLAVLGFSNQAVASEGDANDEREKFNANEVIIEHVLDDHQWHFADHLVLPLPIIVYSSERGLEVFSSSHFYDEHHNKVEYNGYKLEGREIFLTESGQNVLDLSITKNVAMLFIN